MEISANPCDGLFDEAQAARKQWVAVESALAACRFSVAGKKAGEWDPFAVLAWIASVRAQNLLPATIGPQVSLVEQWAQEASQLARDGFDTELRKLAASSGYSVDGRFPDYVVENFLTVKVAPSATSCKVGNKSLKTLMVARVWSEIVSLVDAERRRQPSLEVFLEQCARAYESAIAARSARRGDRVPVKELLRELQIAQIHAGGAHLHAKEKSYTLELLGRDLARLVAASKYIAANGSRLELLPTAFPKDGVAVRSGGTMRIVGHLSFSEPVT